MEAVTREQFAFIVWMLGIQNEFDIDNLYTLYLANLTQNEETIKKAIEIFNINSRFHAGGRFN